MTGTMTWEDIAEQTGRIKEVMRAAGRDPATLEVGVRFPPFGGQFEEVLQLTLSAWLPPALPSCIVR
jgi:hypothetical protein